MQRYPLILTLFMCLISACTPTTSPTVVVTNDDVMLEAQATQTAASVATPDTTTDAADTANDSNGISVTVTGATNLNFTQGTFLTSEQNDAIVLTLFADFQSTNTNVTINDLPYIDETPLTLSLANDDDPATPSAAFIDGRDEFVSYSDNLSGTLTIDSFSETMSGSLTFTAEDAEGNSVTVDATFSGVTIPEQGE